MQASTELCLAFFEFFTVLEKTVFFNQTQSPKAVLSYFIALASKYLKKAKHRSDMLNGWKTIEDTGKSVAVSRTEPFSAFYVSAYKALLTFEVSKLRPMP